MSIKMLKYFAVLFFCFILLSIPSFVIYYNSNADFQENHAGAPLMWFNVLTLGGLDPPKQIASTCIEVTNNSDNLLTATCPGKS